ncbi:thiopurine S-methyltransferase [Acinetobacter junii]|jgi:thiopurine S-methyltransferase|uniref:thiopurine S-methyltransferase n=1 Tax=Acinetobacter junii TaxID=40215 RepID=UPI000C1B14E2|nr:thiopurine S-methyltransferase [Acinetobacter junii]ATU46053.1 thiopurine S-methyltransferase [Acinetobacter junii]
MKHEFWHDKWQKNEIGFHLNQPHSLLVKYIDSLNLEKNNRIFLPLCGKSLDIHWLLAQGYHLIGIDLSPIAIEELISELAIPFTERKLEKLTHYHHPQIDLFVGDFFELTSSNIGKIDAIYDRAALVALPEEMRTDYAQHLMQISNQATQLLISFEYDQSVMAGPPFSISPQQLKDYYSKQYQLQLLDSQTELLKGKVDAEEKIWLLKPY